MSVTSSMISLGIAVTSNMLGSYHSHKTNLVYRLREDYRQFEVNIMSILSRYVLLIHLQIDRAKKDVKLQKIYENVNESVALSAIFC